MPPIGSSCHTPRCSTSTLGTRASIRLTPKLTRQVAHDRFPWTGCYDAKQLTQSKGASMVPADDESTSANESEEDASTQSSFLEKLKFWRRCKQEDDKTARLTHMPACLMHWWTPLLVAFILFSLSFICTLGWGWQWHWPSSNAMKLCMTITGAGLAFSAWQQRSHDNARMEKDRAEAQRKHDTEHEERERNRLEQIERDEYWKRREQIYQLLGSKNPGLRLGAVALLAELADSAAHSNILNNTEKHQLQRHIIDTLCLQLRHEGLNHCDEGNRSEHAEIQAVIFRTILTRIDIQNKESSYADWSREPIKITSCIVHTPVLIANLTTHATIDFSRSKFLTKFELSNVTIPTLLWEQACFIGELITRNNSIIGIRSLPTVAPYSRHIDTTFEHDSETFTITLMSYSNWEIEPAIAISNCKFIIKSTKSATPIEINTIHDQSDGEKQSAQNLHVLRCQLVNITIDATYIHSRISITENTITGTLKINFAEVTNEDGLLERTPHPSDRILIRNNVIHPRDDDEPIRITNYTDTAITKLFSLHNNHISRTDDFSTLHTLEYKILTDKPKPFQFLERTAEGQIMHTWHTGGGLDDLDTNLGPFLSSFFKED